MSAGNSLRIPNYLSAQSAIGLRRLMLRNNIQKGREYNYFSIQYVSGKWFAWYYEAESEENLLASSEVK